MSIIGILGGVGPLAGVDLHKKIILNTDASKDQEHLSVVHMSFSSKIGDRTEYVLQPESLTNPAEVFFSIIEQMYSIGVKVVGIPCNSAHATPIFSVLQNQVSSVFKNKIELVHMIEEVARYIQTHYSKNKIKVGLLATVGTYTCRTYQDVLERLGIEVIVPNIEEQKNVHKSIYHPEYGIKAQSESVSEQAKEILVKESNHLIKRGAEYIIMGCTEIPLVLTAEMVPVPLIDPTMVLAKRLVDLARV